ncbi:MAG TPA: PQQ-binding-like beta-propeller repeat protein, partial [Tepidisphaeraceae bacterium]|nr:PQQ-binding-like beta-propeller repeat protein [Tepidisphaeraceae bacterium]
MPNVDPTYLLYLGIKGTVIALDRRTGAEQWRTPLKGMEFVNLSLDDDSLFATARGEVFCLDPRTGRILWNNPLKGLGWGLITIAGTNIVPFARQQASNAA